MSKDFKMGKRPRDETSDERASHHKTKRPRHFEKDDGDRRPRSDRDSTPAAAGAGAEDGKDGKSGSRYTLFVGNVPFTCPRDALMKHFACVGTENIAQLRMLSRKKEEKLMTDGQVQHKGCGFIEFHTEGALKKALGLHHTFINGHLGRKINVELTAGGGGNGEDRKAKIKAKNEALAEERKKRHDRQEKERAEEAARAAEELAEKQKKREEAAAEKKSKAEKDKSSKPKGDKRDRKPADSGPAAGAWPRKGNSR